MKVFKNGLMTGMILQLAIGPVFFYIINLTLQKSFLDGLIAVIAVNIVDYIYIGLSIIGIGKLLEKKKVNKIFGIISSVILVVFGVVIIKNVMGGAISTGASADSATLLTSFTSAFLLTISNPMTIVFYTSLFTAKAIEYSYTKRELLIFGLATGMATLIFMGSAVVLFSLVKETVPMTAIKIANLLVGGLLVGYGGVRMAKIIKK